MHGSSSKARIGIDLTCLWGVQSGIVNYTIEITRGILENGNGYGFYLYCFGELPSEIACERPNVAVRVYRPRNRKLWQQMTLPILAFRDRIDMLFFPGNSASLFCPCRTVATIHDLHPFVAREAFNNVHGSEVYGSLVKSRINRVYWRRMMKWAARKTRVIAPSQATKDDLCEILGTPADRIDVVHEGVDVEAFSVNGRGKALTEFRERHGLHDRYLLCVGTHGYKNLDGAIRAFAQVRQEGDHELKLVIAGRDEVISQEVRVLVDRLGLGDLVYFTGFFPAEDLKYLYRCAEVFLFPSFYEGFGLPILEAFACDVPVVTSNIGAMPEVAGEAALLVDPNDSAAIARAIAELLNNESLRTEKRELGLKRAKEFGWDQAARQTLEVFSRALAN